MMPAGNTMRQMPKTDTTTPMIRHNVVIGQNPRVPDFVNVSIAHHRTEEVHVPGFAAGAFAVVDVVFVLFGGGYPLKPCLGPAPLRNAMTRAFATIVAFQ